jgi:hypothetical protein
LADEKSNRICEQRKQQDIKEITALIIKWLEGKKMARTKEDLMLKIVEYENAYKADGWFDGRNQLITELVEELR